ncbi:MAG: class I SAM-dependent methyltransferase [Fidelibacterota bacterium]
MKNNVIPRSFVAALFMVSHLLTLPHPPAGFQKQDNTAETRRHTPGQHRFQNAEKWVERFENPERDAWQKPEEVIGLLDLRGDEVVVDIGSGTGYFSVRFASALPRGKVYGADIEPDMVTYLNNRAEKEKLENLTSMVVEPDDPGIPEPVDLVFVCNTYHHIEDRVTYFKNLIDDFRPGGRVVIVDFVKGELPVGPPDHMKLSPETVVSELTQAGYRLLQAPEILPYQYILIFGTPAE